MSAAASTRLRAGIVGISGYSGVELARILARHPGFSVVSAISDKWAGQKVGRFIAVPPPVADVVCLSQAAGKDSFGGLDVVFLCTPAEASIDLAQRALAAGARVVDLSGAFRLSEEEYPPWYGFTHANPALLREAVYSMPEATSVDAAARQRVRVARLLSNPGCYPTASTLAVLPLLQAGLIERDGIIIDAKSGTSGAGRRGSEEMSFSEVADDLRAYRVLRHQHSPEIDRALASAGVPGTRVVFTAHLLPVRRGILATAYGRLTAAGRAGDANVAVQEAFEAFAEGRPFIRVVGAEEVTLHAAVGTNRVVMGAKADASRGIAVVCCAIDNLVKGAAGQAVQNANLMFGLPETDGLLDLMGHAP